MGDHISQVYVHLGDPISREDDTLKWIEHKSNREDEIGVEARFVDDRLVALSCPDPRLTRP